MIQVFEIPKSTILSSYVTGSGFATVSAVAEALPKYNFIINADGWIAGTNKSNSIWYSNGVGKNVTQMDWRPWINFSKSGDYGFGWVRGTHWANYNAVSGSRYLVEDGKVNDRWQAWGFLDVLKSPVSSVKQAVRNEQAWSTELNARTAIGIGYNGDLVVAIVDGRDAPNPEGLSLKGLADLMIAHGCKTAIDLDGGGSTALAINGMIANTPEDDGVKKERSVINHLCLELSEIPGQEPPPVDPPPVDPPPPPVGYGNEYTLTELNNATGEMVVRRLAEVTSGE